MRNDWFKTYGEIKIALKRGGRKGTEHVWVSIDKTDLLPINCKGCGNNQGEKVEPEPSKEKNK